MMTYCVNWSSGKGVLPQVRLTEKGAVFASGAGFDISQFFLSALLKIKTEHVTREAIRQEIKPRRSELIGIINEMTTDISAQQGRAVLVVIEDLEGIGLKRDKVVTTSVVRRPERLKSLRRATPHLVLLSRRERMPDLDKPPLDIARRLFAESFNVLTQPLCAIVYTVPVALYFDPAYVQIRERSYFLPNVKLHPKTNRLQIHRDGWQTMRGFVLARIAPRDQLIADEALNEAVRMSGGVFRELAYICQKSIERALGQGNDKVQKNNVLSAAAHIRSQFRRLLTSTDRLFLLSVRESNEMREPDKLMPLLHLLAVLCDKENWCDTHPVLEPLL